MFFKHVCIKKKKMTLLTVLMSADCGMGMSLNIKFNRYIQTLKSVFVCVWPGDI